MEADESQDSLLLATKRLRFFLQALTEAREREQCKHDWEIFFQPARETTERSTIDASVVAK